MSSESAYVPLPLTVLASLRHLTGEEFKIIGALCYSTYHRQTSQLTVEQIQALSGVPRQQMKPALYRLEQRGWVMPATSGGFYQLALTASATAALPSLTVEYDTALGVRPPRPKPHLLYPEGPWLTETGRLNEDFVRDRAQVWRTGDSYQAKTFGAMAIEDVMGAVCKHYAKLENHSNLEIDWQSYCLKNQRYLANVQQRLQSGAVINQAEQAQVLKKLPLVMQQVLPIYEMVASPLPDSSTAQPLRQPRDSVPLLPQEQQQGQTTLPAKAMPEAMLLRDRLLEIDQLRLWLADPILRQEAEQRALSRGYTLVYSEGGTAIDLRVEA